VYPVGAHVLTTKAQAVVAHDCDGELAHGASHYLRSWPRRRLHLAEKAMAYEHMQTTLSWRECTKGEARGMQQAETAS
jgi:hypothetical protein